MRTEEQMMDLILNKAREDERIRAVVLNGSRANPAAPKDCLQDYDIVYAVRDMPSFLRDHSWVKLFGDRLIMQLPDEMDQKPETDLIRFGYLMLFSDGNRIDLGLVKAEEINEYLAGDSLTVILLDKDGILNDYPPSSDEAYRAAPPSEKQYAACCNEFWWVLQNTAKGIWRDELPFAMRMFTYSRDMLDRMIGWQVGLHHNFAVCTGKGGKYFRNYLSKEYWELYKATYSDSDYGHLWSSIETMCSLFRQLALEVADSFGYTYPQHEEDGIRRYFNFIKNLPHPSGFTG